MKFSRTWLLVLALSALPSCKTTKFVGKDQYLLEKVSVVSNDKTVKPAQLKGYIRQEPNHKVFGFINLPLFLYNLSGRDSTRWINRTLRKAGNAPVIYDEALTVRSVREMTRALQNRGYKNAAIKADTTIRKKKKKIRVRYTVTPNEPYRLENIAYHIPNDTLRRIVLADTSQLLLKKGINFDLNVLDTERQRIADLLRNRGYYAFNKEYITYTADTSAGGHRVDLELNLMPVPEETDGRTVYRNHDTYRIDRVTFLTDFDPMDPTGADAGASRDTLFYKGYYIVSGPKKFIRPGTLVNSCYITPGSLYSTRAVDNTYSAFSRLRIFKFVNIRFVPFVENGEEKLNCYILLTEGKSQTFSTDLEGTNSAGDLGFALGLTYQHRNIFKGSQTLTTKVRGAYESLSGDLGGIINDNYSEIGGEIGLRFPQFLFPFLKSSFRKKLRASTEFTVNVNYQQRPEYTRVIAGGGWRYKWNTRQNRFRHQLDLVDISYIYLPKTINGFLDSIAPDNPLLRYSYENHFIMRSSYVFYRTNLNSRQRNHDVYTLRAAGEIAGNLLYAISKLTDQKRGSAGEYTIGGIRYAQYAKFDMDYAYTFLLSERNSLALHVGFGIAVPYGNSDILPFEKRYYGGGANSVRGWSVRTLGPGTYRGNNQFADFINQCGDIRLDLNAEYRSKVFWKLELAAFVDAGNIWTIRKYAAQPGGDFDFKTFYRELALSYGLGMRLDFNYFILRLDWGIQAYDPSRPDAKKWVIAHEKPWKYSTLHFAVGYPF